MSDSERVLDVGCGYGRISLPLASAGCLVDAIDLSPDADFHDDEAFFQDLCNEAGIGQFQVYEDDWAGRTRLFLRFEKPQR
jgi:SAM-dependent methyltransferase